MVEEASTTGQVMASSQHRMMMVQYLQMQDRIGEAIKLFNTIPVESLPKDGTLRIQHDYTSAYFDFFTG